jgi:hypothetical protein
MGSAAPPRLSLPCGRAGVHVVSCGCCLVHGGPEKRLFVAAWGSIRPCPAAADRGTGGWEAAHPLSGAKNDGSEQPCPGEPETTNCLGSGRVATLALSSCESLEKGTCCIRNIAPVTSKGRRDFRARAHFRARFYCNTGPPSAFRRERCEVQLVNRC